MRYYLSVLAIATATAAGGETKDLEQYGIPAMINFHAEKAEIVRNYGAYRLELSNPSKLATISGNAHKHNMRTFSAFPLSELPDAWNSCNAMKLENEIFHDDGVNSIIAFSAGTAEHGHVSSAPLITQTQEVSATEGDGEGVLYAMLTEAREKGDKLVFTIEGDVKASSFTDVSITTECFTAFGNALQMR